MEDLQAPAVPGYAMGRLLGLGGSASVWLATEQRTQRSYAVKCFQAATGTSAEAGEEAVRREIRILSVLDHPHLVRAHGAVRLTTGPAGPGQEEAATALIMDYASGGSLARLLATRGRLGVGETVTILTPLAQALAYLHGKGFTHADVSPGNVLFTGQGKPLLSDVGIARILGDPTRKVHQGTPGFLDPAPMDAMRAGLQPERDVYSAAAIGWFCLTGEPPPRTADRPPLPLLVPGVPRDLAAALEAGLNEDRRLRPTAAAFATAVYRSAEPVPVDLATAVHPTVIPELLTRKHLPSPSRGSRLLTRIRRVRRRMATSPHLLSAAARVKVAADAGAVGGRAAETAGAGGKQTVKYATGRHADPSGNNRLKAGYVVRAANHHPARRPAGATSAHREPRRGQRLRRKTLAACLVLAAALSVWAAAAGLLPLPAGGTKQGGSGTPVEETLARAFPGTAGDTAANNAAADNARELAAAADPAMALQGLAALRDQAFSSGNLSLLDEVNAGGSPAASADQAIGQRLRSSGVVLAGFTSTLSGVAIEEGPAAGRAVVRTTTSTSPWQETAGDGTVVARGAAGPERHLRLVLVSVDGRWRISEILPVP